MYIYTYVYMNGYTCASIPEQQQPRPAVLLLPPPSGPILIRAKKFGFCISLINIHYITVLNIFC